VGGPWLAGCDLILVDVRRPLRGVDRKHRRPDQLDSVVVLEVRSIKQHTPPATQPHSDTQTDRQTEMIYDIDQCDCVCPYVSSGR